MNSKALSLLVILGLVAPLGACVSEEGGEEVEEQAPTTAPAAEDEGGEGGEGGDEAEETEDEDEGGEG
ncbi:MAG: hypothetical protein WBB29_08175 [Geitlerinemataceae cyanobacterium]